MYSPSLIPSHTEPISISHCYNLKLTKAIVVIPISLLNSTNFSVPEALHGFTSNSYCRMPSVVFPLRLLTISVQCNRPKPNSLQCILMIGHDMLSKLKSYPRRRRRRSVVVYAHAVVIMKMEMRNKWRTIASIRSTPILMMIAMHGRRLMQMILNQICSGNHGLPVIVMSFVIDSALMPFSLSHHHRQEWLKTHRYLEVTNHT